ncbi:unnamed protein product [Spirodela intermedia]|uniref:Uncharacterized protein n=2 Tax=Spirodela intermedia TaxID=51605 RepID=A0A7I8KRM4_SPIIN|nr:unnamed protein product [Spirodela intermedia]CAA6663615.1 unnamed protein product [Spirodela intermedia]CAA7400102.1 unnamed protein product [Spirodela intermedia]
MTIWCLVKSIRYEYMIVYRSHVC